jgi:hypothetical protein
MQADTPSNIELIRKDWANLNQQIDWNMDSMIYVLKLGIEKETDENRKFWLKESLKNLKAAQTFMLRTNSALNSATRPWETLH